MNWAKLADHVLIVDTGSSDSTINIFREFGAEVYETKISPWRFDLARNTAFNKIREMHSECEIFVTADLDNVMWPEDKWRTIVENEWINNQITRLWIPWYWNMSEPDQLNFDKCWIHSVNYEWLYPVHEKLVPLQGYSERYLMTHKVALLEYPEEKDRNYTDLLILSVQEYPESAAHHLWLAVSLFWDCENQYERAIEEFSLYLSSPSQNKGIPWIHKKHIRAYAYRMIGNINGGLGRVDKQYENLERSIVESPDQREGWVTLASYYLSREMYWECYLAAERSLAIPREDWLHEWPLVPCVWNECPYQLISACASKIEGQEWMEIGCAASKIAYEYNSESGISKANYLHCQIIGFNFETGKLS